MNFAEEAVSHAREDKDYAIMYLAMAVGELQKHTAPPQRKPLTDDERRKAFVRWYQTCECLMSPDAIFDQAFQEAEATHGIKE